MDPHAQPAAFYPFCPERNVTADYPPTLLLHGTADTDVPYHLSAGMAAVLEQAGVTHKLTTIPDGPHGFDGQATRADLDAGSPSLVAQSLHRTLGFLAAHL
ncbi:MAG: hypothetical protein CL878_07675 [Dehalococcoidia bacterium]|nr:hypothetical protein [Dehalococcoidia bacterium]